MDKKTKIVAVTILGLAALIDLVAAILHGRRAEWFMFGLSLTGCVIMIIFFTAALFVYKIDSRFNQLEKLLGDQHQKEKEKKIIGQSTDKSTEV